MEIKAKFDHFNINVTNLERSIAFYDKALGLKEHHRKEASNGSFTLVYLTDNSTGFLLELTCLKDHPQAYELGEDTKAIYASVLPVIMKLFTNTIKKWVGYALKIQLWDCTSSMIRMITG